MSGPNLIVTGVTDGGAAAVQLQSVNNAGVATQGVALSDGTTVAAVKASGAAAATTDGAAVFAQSPNRPASLAQSVVMTALNNQAAVITTGMSSVGLQITGTWTGTLAFEATIDGTTYFSVPAFNPATSAAATTTTAVLAGYRIPCDGYNGVRVRSSVVGTGTAVVSLQSSNGAQILPLPAGTNSIGSVSVTGTVTTAGTTTATQGTAGASPWLTKTVEVTTSASALAALNAVTTTLNLGGNKTCGVAFPAASTFVGAITPYYSLDGGTTYFPTTFLDGNDEYATVAGTASTTYAIKLRDGANAVQLKATAFTSGTVTPVVTASSAGPNTALPVNAQTGTITAVASTTTANTTALAGNKARKGAYFYNQSTAICYLSFTTTCSVALCTLAIQAGGLYELPAQRDGRVYDGNITCIFSAASAGNLLVTETV